MASSARLRIGVLAFVILSISDTFSAESFLEMTFLIPVLLLPPLIHGLKHSTLARLVLVPQGSVMENLEYLVDNLAGAPVAIVPGANNQRIGK